MARILIIEDDEAFRAILKEALEGAGHSVAEAATGRKAISMIRTDPPEVVLTDLVMPDQDGIGVILMIRDEFPNTPFVAMSGSSINAGLYLNMAKKLGARHVLQKPFGLETMVAAVDDVLKNGP